VTAMEVETHLLEGWCSAPRVARGGSINPAVENPRKGCNPEIATKKPKTVQKNVVHPSKWDPF
ncbi:MAG: hypothetical protein Q6L60_06185, partial [Thermostichus sp. HHBFW_bins_43]